MCYKCPFISIATGHSSAAYIFQSTPRKSKSHGVGSNWTDCTCWVCYVCLT